MSKTYKSVEKEILDIPKFSKKTTKENLKNIYASLNLKEAGIIHVAGTNGKGSVCAFITSVLMESGKKVGTFTSPHLISMTERIRINNENVDEYTFTEAYEEVQKAVKNNMEKGGEHPSFFELIFLMAMYIFSKENVEYIVLETGLGGRLDATNMFDKPLISIITSVSLDHMEILGETIEEIATEKAGIIKQDVPVVFYGENNTVKKVVEKMAVSRNSRSYCVKKSDVISIKKCKNNIAFSLNSSYYEYGGLEVPFIADYQVVNATLAIKALEVMNGLYSMGITIDNIRTGIGKTRWEARMEQVMPQVFIDGAHNDDGIDEFVKVVADYKCDGKKIIIFSAVKEKEYDKMIKRVATETGIEEFIVPTIDNPRALKYTEICDIFKEYADSSHIYGFDYVRDALKKALQLKEKEDVLFIAGSLYLAGEVKKVLSDTDTDKYKNGGKS